MTETKWMTKEDIVVRIQEIYQELKTVKGDAYTKLDTELHGLQHIMSYLREHSGGSTIEP